MLCKCCANLGIKKVKVLKISTLTLTFVGITALYYPSKFFYTIGLLYAWKSIRNPYNTGDSRTELHIFFGLKKM